MKRPVALVTGIIIIVLSIVGFSSYFKDFPFKLGKPSNGGGTGGGSPELGGSVKGDYLHCYEEESGSTEEMYMSFTNGIADDIVIVKFTGKADLKEHTKIEWESRAAEMCDEDKTSHSVNNCSLTWNGDILTLTGNMQTPDMYKGLSKTAVETKVKENSSEEVVCKNVKSAPRVIPGGTLRINKNTENSSNNKTVTVEKSKNSHMKMCYNASYEGGGEDLITEYVFYCDKDVVQRNIDINISATFSETRLFGKKQGNFTKADAEKELRNRYCGVISDCDITWKNENYVVLSGTCKTNYAGLPKSTLEEFSNDWSYENNLKEICE